MKHKLFTTLLVMLMSMTGSKAFAQDSNYYDIKKDGLYYKYINNGEELEVVFPDDDSNYEWDCFPNYYTQESIEIPNEIRISSWSYDYKPVTSIGNSAFRACENLKSITIPSSVTHIGKDVFYHSDLLESIVVEDGNEKYDSRDDCNAIIETNSNTLIAGCKSTTIPYSLEKVNNSALKECKGLKSVRIPYGLKEIGDSAFYECSSLESIDFDDWMRVDYIGESAFENCKKLYSITMPTGVYGIHVYRVGNMAFYGCEALTSANLYIDNIGAYSFAYTGIEEFFVYVGTINIGYKDWGDWGVTYTPLMECKNLKTVSVYSENHNYDSRNGFNGIIETSSGKLIFATPTKRISLPQGIKSIATQAIVGGKIDFVDLGEGVETLAPLAFHASEIGKLKYPSTITSAYMGTYSCTIDTLEIKDIKAWCEYSDDVLSNLQKELTFVVNGKIIKDLVVPQGTNRICRCAFFKFDINSVTIPSSVTSIGYNAFYKCTNLSTVKVEWETPISITSYVFENCTKDTLYVPRGSKAAYEAADYWKDFKVIKEYGEGNETIAMGSSGIATYSNNSDLNFTDVSGLKAYIASGFNPATGALTMTRVYEVPAGEGLILKGAADSYEVPYEETSAYYANLLVGVPTATTVNPTDGSYTNFILANDAVKGIGFYPLASAGEIGPNKAYLQLPTSILPPASARQFRMVFEDEEDVTGINALNDKGAISNEKFFDLQGRRVIKPTRGLYIKDGKKIMVK